MLKKIWLALVWLWGPVIPELHDNPPPPCLYWSELLDPPAGADGAANPEGVA